MLGTTILIDALRRKWCFCNLLAPFAHKRQTARGSPLSPAFPAMPSLPSDAIGKRWVFAPPGRPHSQCAKRAPNLISQSHPREAVGPNGSFGVLPHISRRIWDV